MTRRTERINALLRNEISQIIAVGLKDPRLHALISITQVQTTPDLAEARVFVSVLGDEKGKSDALQALKSAAGFIHRALRPRLDLRFIPTLSFVADDSIERDARLLATIKQAMVGIGPADAAPQADHGAPEASPPGSTPAGGN